MLKNLLLKKMLEKQLADVPQEERERLLAMVAKNPGLFEKIAMDAKKEIDRGVPQMQALMSVAKKYETELKQLKEE